jgi:hypothetical protein
LTLARILAIRYQGHVPSRHYSSSRERKLAQVRLSLSLSGGVRRSSSAQLGHYKLWRLKLGYPPQYPNFKTTSSFSSSTLSSLFQNSDLHPRIVDAHRIAFRLPSYSSTSSSRLADHFTALDSSGFQCFLYHEGTLRSATSSSRPHHLFVNRIQMSIPCDSKP